MKNLLLTSCLMLFTIHSFSQCTATAVATPILCFGSCDGTATVISTGIPPLTISWNTTPIQTTATATGLCAGNYTATVVDGTGNTCSANVNIASPSAIVINVSSTPASCGTCPDGTATAIVTGGNAPYVYDWGAGPTLNNSLSNLAPGVYTLCITDATGCTTCTQVTVTFATEITEPSFMDNTFIYPNPTTGKVSISLGEVHTGSFKVFNSLGQAVLEDKFNNTQEHNINLDLPAGLYFLRLEVDGKVITKKIVKE